MAVAKDDVPGAYKWLVLLAAFLIQLFVSGITYCVGIYYVIFKENIGGSSTLISLVGALNTAFFFGIGPLAGVLTERYGCRPVAILGSLIGTIGMAVNVFVTEPWQLILTFGVLTGCGIGLCYIPSIAIVGMYFNKRRSMAMGIAVTGLGAGPIAFPPILSYLNNVFGWRGAIFMISGIFLHTTVFAALLRPVTTCKSPDAIDAKETEVLDETKNEKTNDATGVNKGDNIGLNLGVFKKVGFTLFFIQNILFSFGLSVINVHIGAYALSKGHSGESAAMLFFTMGLASALSRIFYGFLAQVPAIGPTRLFTFTSIICGVCTVGYPFGWSYVSLSVCAALIGAFYGSYGSLPPLITVDLTSIEQLPSAYGYICVADALGFLLGGPAAGWLYDSTSNYPASFFLGGGFMISSGFSMLPVWYSLYCSRTKSSKDQGEKVAVL